jgi:hypothetical protein
MKKFFTLLIISIFTISINAQQTQANLNYLKSARKKIGAGTTLMIVGGGTIVGGSFLFTKGSAEINADPDFMDNSYDGTAEVIGGLACMITGAVLMEIGIPFLIVGGVQKGRANRRLHMTMVNFKTPNSRASINGVGLKLNF